MPRKPKAEGADSGRPKHDIKSARPTSRRKETTPPKLSPQQEALVKQFSETHFSELVRAARTLGAKDADAAANEALRKMVPRILNGGPINVMVVMSSVVGDQHREEARRKPTDTSLAGMPTFGPEAQGDFSGGLSTRELFGRIKGSLDQRQFAVFQLVLQSFSAEEIALKLSIPVEEVNQQIAEARAIAGRVVKEYNKEI